MELMPSAMSRATVVVYESETVTALHLLSSGVPQSCSYTHSLLSKHPCVLLGHLSPFSCFVGSFLPP